MLLVQLESNKVVKYLLHPSSNFLLHNRSTTTPLDRYNKLSPSVFGAPAV